MSVTSRKVRTIVLLGSLSFLTFVSIKQFMPAGSAQTTIPVPSQGKIPEFDTGGKVPGNPANAVQDLQEIHRLIGVYKSRDGAYPSRTLDLLQDIQKQPEVYGYSVPTERGTWPEAFMNSDYAYADGNKTHNPNGVVPYITTDRRPDGTPIGGAKLPGQKDVLAYTDIYIHRNVHRFPKSRTTENPVGFFVVLWDDGTVTQVPYDELIYVPTEGNTEKRGKYGQAFPGQAGIPANAVTYDQFYQKLGWKKGPRGKEGDLGLSYDTYK